MSAGDFTTSKWTFKNAPAPMTLGGWGILNKRGAIWTHQAFDTPEEAYAYLNKHVHESVAKTDFLIAPVTVTIAVNVEATEHTIQIASPKRSLDKAA